MSNGHFAVGGTMARCLNCGADNPDYVHFCGRCGNEIVDGVRPKDLPSDERVPTRSPDIQPPSPVELKTTVGVAQSVQKEPEKRKCTWCGKEVNASVYLCPFCGKNPWGPWGRNARDEALYQAQSESIDGIGAYGSAHANGGLTAGGVLAIVAGVLALGQGLLYSVIGSTFSILPGSGSLCLCGGIDALFGAMSILGGISALKRSNWGLAVFGATLGMLGLGLLIGGLIGLIALVLIAASRNDFES